ncbi:hypothetical protein CAPTEDRAFT_199607 [Capitella teleta]|uniref:Sulfotransferase domain-containing protein n=1 Tax=Capitella teleta TaxID=283909 RepID=R7U8C5_CAPTE|nr:hypothetical protein CAPTEDRAFT_199607 [Capitella teleta]|eukprot:ELU02635.1 hypothetical protein CAPTEDRAFT_199607 [Capitella teleta]
MTDKKYLHEIQGMHESGGVLYLASTPEDHLKNIKKYEFQKGDVLVNTFSKSGTTWTQEILYLLHNGVNPEEASHRPIKHRVPFIDFNRMWSRVMEMTPPRIFKSHLRSNFFARELRRGDLKVVVTLRNPKDTLVSFYHFYKTNMAFGNFQGEWNDFFEIIRKGELIYGDWFDFTLGWWSLRNEANVLVLKYEEMKRNPALNVQKMADFCGKEISQEQLELIVDSTSFVKMQKNASVNYADEAFMKKGETFMRKGKTGGWKEYFNQEQNQYIDDLLQTRCQPLGLDFDFED